MTAPAREGRARVWVGRGLPLSFPEREPSVSNRYPLTGVCLSGGSTRSLAAAVGQLRGLTALGLIPRIGYLSAVSGGAWAAAPYVYYPVSGVTDSEILGAVVPPEEISLSRLETIDQSYLGYSATLDLKTVLETLERDSMVPADEVWSRGVGQTFLAPFGLFVPAHPAGFTLDRETLQAILDRNPYLQADDLQLIRVSEARPYLLIHATLNWPTGSPEHTQKINFECSPLYVGAPRLHTMHTAGGMTCRLGGGYLEPFAFGCQAPLVSPDAQGLVPVTVPERLFTLAHAIGASSAFSTPDRELRKYPHARCWPITGCGGEDTAAEVLTDGGDLENYGLISLLRRRVAQVIVFINTVWPLALDYDPSRWPRRVPCREIDPFLAPLFGQPSERFPHNQVFQKVDYVEIVRTLQRAKRAGCAVIATRTHRVYPNNWWGVEGGWDVRICWVYNERVLRWEERLRPELRGLIARGHGSSPAGPFAHFPHYRTQGQNRGSFTRLTPVQVNLLAHLSCWNVTSNAEIVRELFSG